MAIPEFIVKLREHVGAEPLWLPAVTAVIIRDVPAGAPFHVVPDVLLVKRADTGEWTPPTGICDPDEQPHVTAAREVREETGLDVRVEALLGVGAVGPVTYGNGDVASYMDTSMRCVVSGSSDEPIVGDEENTDVAWFPISNMPVTNQRFRMVIADAVAQLKHPQGFRPRMGYEKRTAQ
ncbi:NUDIX hydrolase [Corynebacterium crudilactis]|uniref:DNA mismatch repair protein MutT n=1 Tax=Corynebacterium crudilactis TaxID=1652495 RepID=A0A172QUT5_9CORY|nr:NUDIX domain-containing protein [Corynebacterium crudilactis]ANE04457.1 DNA mismatch repair protein MutT [Corynebacterium crudilactis]